MRYRVFTSSALLLLLATVAHGQTNLHGRVIDHTSGGAVSAVVVLLQDARGRNLAQQFTDTAGLFNFRVVHDGAVRLKADRIGYRGIITPTVELKGFSNYQVEVRLDPNGVVLAPLEVIARDRGPTLRGFDTRRLRGSGTYITRSDIENSKANSVTDLLATVRGIWFQRSGQSRIVFMRASCPAQVYIDGALINRPVTRGARRRSSSDAPIDEMLKLNAIEGIEIYEGVSTVPAEFLTPEAACGVLAIWTRRGD